MILKHMMMSDKTFLSSLIARSAAIGDWIKSEKMVKLDRRGGTTEAEERTRAETCFASHTISHITAFTQLLPTDLWASCGHFYCGQLFIWFDWLVDLLNLTFLSLFLQQKIYAKFQQYHIQKMWPQKTFPLSFQMLDFFVIWSLYGKYLSS